MEVHAHSHTARKKWTHYFWEFFMLFLAVFCGFLAENQREHFVEHKREKAYMKTMIADLEEDNRLIHIMSEQNKELMQGLDSLSTALDTLDLSDKKQLLDVYTLFYTWGSTPHYVKFSDRTISQLQSAGGMRLIRKRTVSDSITFYYSLVDLCNKQFDTYWNDMNNLVELSYKLFDKLYTQKGHENMEMSRQLFIQNPVGLREFVNRATDLKEVVGSYNDLLRVMNFFSKKISDQIKNEYHLK